MSRVNILDSSITNKIAAGEVVEKPAAIVKELVENSIDAKSKNIIVKITSGGKNSIEIIDDLFNINSFGFRGEALPSIASVSRVSLKSRSEEFDYGMSISLEGGTIINKEECSCNIGTEIIVKDIFFNTLQ